MTTRWASRGASLTAAGAGAAFLIACAGLAGELSGCGERSEQGSAGLNGYGSLSDASDAGRAAPSLGDSASWAEASGGNGDDQSDEATRVMTGNASDDTADGSGGEGDSPAPTDSTAPTEDAAVDHEEADEISPDVSDDAIESGVPPQDGQAEADAQVEASADATLDAAPDVASEGAPDAPPRNPTETLLLSTRGEACLDCARVNGCVDPGRTCGDFAALRDAAGPDAGDPREALCTNTLACELATYCYDTGSDVDTCICGPQLPSKCLSGGPLIVHGAECVAEERAGLGTSDPRTELLVATQRTLGAGMANALIVCLKNAFCVDCQ